MAFDILKWLVLFMVCIVLQSTLTHTIAVFDIQPDFVIIALFLLSIRHGSIAGVYAGFFVGLGQDLYSPAILGLNALAKTLIGYFIGIFNEKVMSTDPVMKAVILLSSIFLHDTIFLAAHIIKTSASWGILLPEILTNSIPRGLYTIVFIVLYSLWAHLFKPSLRR
ncbi:MAG: rod shape-determining protein MreD [Chitinivibrionales bacterium]|nr:rod shape-determining protein MreD [Chitinivibrionales bacterium]